MNIGVIQPLPGIGDMVWHLPALRAIAAASPDGKIVLFAKASSQAKALFAADPLIEKIVELNPKRGAGNVIANYVETLHLLKGANLDRIFILHHSLRYRAAAKLSGIPNIQAYPRPIRRLRANGWEKSLAFLREIDIPVADPFSHLTVSPRAFLDVLARFHDSPRPWLVLAPSASSPERLWPIDRFAKCADAFVETQKGAGFLIGAADEAGLVNKLYASCKNKERIHEIIGQPFDRVMALMAASDAVLGNDSGPVNVAAALGKKSFVLCGVTRPPMHSQTFILIAPDSPDRQGMAGIGADLAADFLRKNFT